MMQAGNGMSLPCIGAALCWVLEIIATSLIRSKVDGNIPRALSLPSLTAACPEADPPGHDVSSLAKPRLEWVDYPLGSSHCTEYGLRLALWLLQCAESLQCCRSKQRIEVVWGRDDEKDELEEVVGEDE
eukprot:8123415-Pyramimonas_sp.AAC.1